MQVLALVPARSGSRGVPGKNIKWLAGRPLIAYTIDAARQSRSVSRTIVSTDSEAIADVARSLGVDVPFLRPSHLAADDTPTHQVITHALDWLAAASERLPDVVVLLQPTVPFRPADQIDRAVTILSEAAVDAVVSVVPVVASYHADWQLAVRDGLLERYSGGPVASLPTRRQDLPPTYVRDGSVYAFKTEAFRRTGTFYGAKTAALVGDQSGVNIDTPDDWARAEAIIAADRPR
jgi:CMP-N,N'-diacetyllegionaminic acid synthase